MEEPPAPWETSEPCMLGIDEAGRGPCLGPMVYSAAYCKLSDHERLVELGANDSKQLKEEDRARLRAIVDNAEFVGAESVVLHADELSAKMLRPTKYNLNAISHDTALALVDRAIQRGVNVKEIYVDTVGPPDAYAKKFRDAFPSIRKITVEKKADSKFAVVSVASIFAKTTRDHHVNAWVFPESTRSVEAGGDKVVFDKGYGSGYPSDPRTQKWLGSHVHEVFGFPTFMRFSWSTSRVLLEREAAEVSWACDVEEDDCNRDFSGEKRKFGSIDSFFKPSTGSASTKKTSPALWKKLGITHVSSL